MTRFEQYQKTLLPSLEWQRNHGKDPIADFPCGCPADLDAALGVIRSYWGASAIRALNADRRPGVYRAVVRFERSITIVYHRTTTKEA